MGPAAMLFGVFLLLSALFVVISVCCGTLGTLWLLASLGAGLAGSVFVGWGIDA